MPLYNYIYIYIYCCNIYNHGKEEIDRKCIVSIRQNKTSIKCRLTRIISQPKETILGINVRFKSQARFLNDFFFVVIFGTKTLLSQIF